jgi:hypothetical protein
VDLRSIQKYKLIQESSIRGNAKLRYKLKRRYRYKIYKKILKYINRKLRILQIYEKNDGVTYDRIYDYSNKLPKYINADIFNYNLEYGETMNLVKKINEFGDEVNNIVENKKIKKFNNSSHEFMGKLKSSYGNSKLNGVAELNTKGISAELLRTVLRNSKYMDKIIERGHLLNVVKTLIKDKIRFAVFCRSNGVFKKKFI